VPLLHAHADADDYDILDYISYRDLHCIKPNYTDLNINVKLYDYIKIFVEFYIANTNIAKIYIHVVFRRRR
jgi:hypothetical protein